MVNNGNRETMLYFQYINTLKRRINLRVKLYSANTPNPDPDYDIKYQNLTSVLYSLEDKILELEIERLHVPV